MTSSQIPPTIPVAIIGGGIAGIMAGRTLADRSPTLLRVFERAPQVGGIAGSFRVGAFTFDYGLHCFFTSIASVAALIETTFADQHERITTHEALLRDGAWLGYPPHLALASCPPQLREDCLVDLWAAAAQPADRPPAHYAAWCYRHYGATISEQFLFPFVRKYWVLEPDQLPPEGAGRRSRPPDIRRIIRGAFGTPTESHEQFFYPRSGGFQYYCDVLAVNVPVCVNAEVVAIDLDARELRFADGARCRYQHLISTLPLPTLLERIIDAPPALRDAAANLNYTSLALVSLGLALPDVLPYRWIYSYDPNISFTRLVAPHKLSAQNVPPGQSALQAEIYYRGAPPDAHTLYQRTLDDLHRLGLLPESAPIVACDVRYQTFANVILDAASSDVVRQIHAFLAAHDVAVCGRYATWDNGKFDQVISQAQQVARDVLNRLS